MKELLMTDSEAERLINMIKTVIEPVSGVLEYGDEGSIQISNSDESYIFYLDYKYEKRKKVFNFRETKYNNYCLLRINLSDGFHRNSDGIKVTGNRINIFSEEEYYYKADGKTHMKAYKLPYKNIENTDDFLKALSDILDYTNTDEENINLMIQSELLY